MKILRIFDEQIKELKDILKVYESQIQRYSDNEIESCPFCKQSLGDGENKNIISEIKKDIEWVNCEIESLQVQKQKEGFISNPYRYEE